MRIHNKIEYRNYMPSSLKSLDSFKDACEFPPSNQLKEERKNGIKVVGTFCLYVPDEESSLRRVPTGLSILWRKSRYKEQVAERELRGTYVPLIKSSFGAVVDAIVPGETWHALMSPW